ncbi:MAG: sigma factor-like helix-turn-helix DNA-binding protein, partial [bacterium]|nr:sigma factor-like helix-turn-helix DNA-binding protein [bacterium]
TELPTVKQEIIANLPAAQREILLLREKTNLTFQEIAKVTGCSTNTVKGRMHYALLALRQGLKDRGYETR